MTAALRLVTPGNQKQHRTKAKDSRGRINSPALVRQRELAWLLYITEGYIANVEHALTVNGYTLDRAALRLMHDASRGAAGIARGIRKGMQP